MIEQSTSLAPRALIFDLDETLLDGSGLRKSIARTCELLAARRSDLNAAALIEANGKVWAHYWPEVEERWHLGAIDGAAASLEGWWRALAACGCDDASLAAFALQTHLRLARAAHRLFDDVNGVFAAAKTASVPLALVTNGAADIQREKLEVLGIEGHFDAVIISGEIGIAKPNPAIFAMALNELGVGPENVWHIGDSLKSDVAGAKAAGLGAVWLNRKGDPRPAGASEPDVEIGSLRRLLSMLASEQARGPLDQ